MRVSNFYHSSINNENVVIIKIKLSVYILRPRLI
jgi:hypothetical protein